MTRIHRLLLTAICLMSLTGCETIKVVLGTSIRHLETARQEAQSKTFDCTFEQCFDAILTLAHNESMGDSMSGKKPFEVFMKDRVKSYIVVMGLEGNIDTTEVGIFLERDSQGIKVEISSLSTSAKEKVADAVFGELNLRFNKIS